MPYRKNLAFDPFAEIALFATIATVKRPGNIVALLQYAPSIGE
jgi:hypothetical protein